MIKFTLDIRIEKPLNTTIRLFNDRDLLSKWQPGLLSSEAVPNKGGLKKYKLIYQIGRRKLPMIESRLKMDLPEQSEVEYTLKGITNTVKNTFSSPGPESTRWISEYEFRFKGLMKLIGPFMRSGLEQQSKTIMKNFKRFAEQYKD